MAAGSALKAGPAHLLLEIPPIGLPVLAIVDLPRQGMELLAFEQTASNAPPERGIGQIVEDEQRFLHASQLPHGPVKVIARAAGEQALERD